MYEFEILSLEYAKLAKDHRELKDLINKQKKRKAVKLIRNLKAVDSEFIKYALMKKGVTNTNANFMDWLSSDYIKRIELIDCELKLFFKMYNFLFGTEFYLPDMCVGKSLKHYL
mgnify:CR=1 FL=1